MNKLNLSNTDDRIFAKMLRTQAQHAGDTEFLISDALRITFAEADQITDALASGFVNQGIIKGDRIALYMGNRLEMVLLALAINKIGAIWVPTNADYKGEWLLDTLNRSRCKALVTDDQFQQRIVDIQHDLDVNTFISISDNPASGFVPYSDLLLSEPLQADYSDMHYGDTCAILWTSGTTGKSKGVMQSYNGWIRAINDGASVLFDSQPGDSIYCVLPLFNAAAWITCIFRSLIEGIPCIIEPKFSVTDFWPRIKHFGATQTFLLGAMGVFVLRAPEKPGDADNPLRVVQVVPLPPEMWPVFEKRFDVRLPRIGLGQSECLLVTTQTEDRPDVPVYALGFPNKDTELALLDDAGCEVAIGEVGEISIKPLAPHIVFNGYFDSPEATAEAYTGDWYRTGDVGKQDPDSGAYFYVDRKKDALRYAGRNISTLEVEGVVRRHPAVDDVAVFGIASEEIESEHEVKINIVLKEGHSPSHEDICQFINENAPFYFVPRYMDFVDSLPYTPTNKVQKYILREAGIGSATWDLKTSDYQIKR
jgi:crotonobetaine/carnitine-CoA ligase